MSTREAVIEMIRRMPDDVTMEEIMHALYVRQRIEEGIRELDAGEGIPHEGVRQRLNPWLD
jgi:hypothetical protein